MSQTGYSKVQIYSSSTATNTPSASNLTNDTNGSELAINITDGKLFYKDNGGTVQVIASKASNSGNFANTINVPNTFGFKNRIINGAMTANQYVSSAVTLSSSVQFPLDRFGVAKSSGATITAQQSSTAPAGFSNSIKFAVTTGASPSSSDYNVFFQRIEGYNFADLNWGTANAKSATVSFWVQSSVTGTYSIYIRSGDNNLSYLANYTISSANTWQQVSITITPPTSGTFNTNNTQAIQMSWDLGSGSTYQGTANTWLSGGYVYTGTQTPLSAVTGATFYITGVQLEVGTQATSFDYRPYGTELALCQRYYQYLGGSTTSGDQYIASGMCNTTVQARFSYIFPVPMRTSPAVTFPSASNFNVYSGAVTPLVTAIVTPGVVDYRYMGISATVASGLTVGYGALLLAENTTSSAIQISAEL